MKLWRKIVGIIFVVMAIWLFVASFQAYKYPKEKELSQRINYLERAINESAAGSDIKKLGDEFHEWELFTYAFTAYSMTNIAIRDTNFKQRAVKIIKTAIKKVLDPKVASNYDVNPSKLKKDSIPAYSVLYLGHLNLMMGCYRRLSDDPAFNGLNDQISKSLYEKYTSTAYVNLESYRHAIWIPDNTVAMASLALHSSNTGSAYNTVCQKWSHHAKAHYLDEKTGVLCSTLEYQTGAVREEPRGSMLGWSILFIYQFDSTFAIDLYQNYKRHFSKNHLNFRLFKEQYKNKETNMGDIDSGPIFRGYSIPANEFALGGAVLAKDFRTAKKLQRLINFGTKSFKSNNELRYKVRFVDMHISPMAEALVLHSLTITKWTK